MVSPEPGGPSRRGCDDVSYPDSGGQDMSLRTTLAAAAVMLAATVVGTVPTRAEDALYIPLLTYRTGPFASSGIPSANGMHDYLEMLNERDGGVRLAIEECETGS